MEGMLRIMMNLVALGLAGIAVIAAVAVGLGDVRPLRNPVARIIVTPCLAVLGLWILSIGIQHVFSR